MKNVAIILALLAVALLSSHSVTYAAEPSPVADSGIEILDVRLGTHVDSKKRVPVPYTSFRPSEPTIVASVHTFAPPGSAIDATLGALWTFDTAEGPQTVIDASAELEFDGEGFTVFKISNVNPWPSGTYHLELFLEGGTAYKTTFSVK